MIKALVLVRSRRLLQTRKIMEPFPAAATMDNVQPRIVNQVSIEENRTTSAYVQLGADGKKHSFCYFWLKAGGATNRTGINKSVNARLTPILHPKIQIQGYHVVIVEHNLNWKLYKLLDRKER